MRTIQITDKGPLLADLVDAVEHGGESEIVIERDGKPVARILPPDHKPRSEQRVILGIMEGKVKLPEGWEDDFKAQRKEIEELIYDSSLEETGDQTYVLDPSKIKTAE